MQNLSPTRSTKKPSVNHQVYVGGIATDISKEALTSHFKEFGNLLQVRIPREKKTGKGRGFAILTFEEEKSVQIVLSQNHSMNGRSIQVEPALDPEELKKKLENYSKFKIYVGKVPKKVKEAEFRKYFTRFGAIKRAYLLFDSTTGKSRGFGYVEFTKRESALKALKTKGHKLSGVEIVVSEMKLKRDQVNRNSKQKESRTYNSFGNNSNYTSISPNKKPNQRNCPTENQNNWLHKFEKKALRAQQLQLLGAIEPPQWQEAPIVAYGTSKSLSPTNKRFFGQRTFNFGQPAPLHSKRADRRYSDNQKGFSLRPKAMQSPEKKNVQFSGGSWANPISSISEDEEEEIAEQNVPEFYPQKPNITSLSDLGNISPREPIRTNQASIEQHLENYKAGKSRSPYKLSTLAESFNSCTISPQRRFLKDQQRIPGVFWIDELLNSEPKKAQSSLELPSRLESSEIIFSTKGGENYRVNVSRKSVQLCNRRSSRITCDTMTFKKNDEFVKLAGTELKI